MFHKYLLGSKSGMSPAEKWKHSIHKSRGMQSQIAQRRSTDNPTQSLSTDEISSLYSRGTYELTDKNEDQIFFDFVRYLHEAIIENNSISVKQMLSEALTHFGKKKFETICKSEEIQSHHATDHLSQAKQILINIAHSDSTLVFFILRNEFDLLKLLLTFRVYKQSVTPCKTLLHVACSPAVQDDDRRIPKLLIQWGIDVNAKDEAGITALHWAARTAKTAVVEFLLNAGAIITSSPTYSFKTNLFNKALELIRFKDSISKLTARQALLFTAVRYGYHGTFAMLTKSDENFHIRNKYGHTLLHIAAMGNGRKYNLEASIELIDRFLIDIDAQDNEGNTALFYAKYHDNKPLISLLTNKAHSKKRNNTHSLSFLAASKVYEKCAIPAEIVCVIEESFLSEVTVNFPIDMPVKDINYMYESLNKILSEDGIQLTKKLEGDSSLGFIVCASITIQEMGLATLIQYLTDGKIDNSRNALRKDDFAMPTLKQRKLSNDLESTNLQESDLPTNQDVEKALKLAEGTIVEIKRSNSIITLKMKDDTDKAVYYNIEKLLIKHDILALPFLDSKMIDILTQRNNQFINFVTQNSLPKPKQALLIQNSPITEAGTAHERMLKEMSEIRAKSEKSYQQFFKAVDTNNYGQALRCACTVKVGAEFEVASLISILLRYHKQLNFEINEPSKSNGKSAIHYAAEYGLNDLYNLLLPFSQDKYLRDNDGKLPSDYLADRLTVRVPRTLN